MKQLILIIITISLTNSIYANANAKQYNSKDIVAKTIWFESGNQSLYGKKCVASVIYNRSKSNPKDLIKVCLAKKQFSCWNKTNHNIVKIRPSTSYEDCKSFANDMSTGEFHIVNGFSGVNYYHEKSVRPKWAKSKWFVCRVEDHLFYRIPS